MDKTQWDNLDAEDLLQICYFSMHLVYSEEYSEDPYSEDSRDLALDGFAGLKRKWQSGVRNEVADYVADMPVFGPVDGTGRPDPEGAMMLDVPRDGLADDIRNLDREQTTVSRRRRR